MEETAEMHADGHLSKCLTLGRGSLVPDRRTHASDDTRRSGQAFNCKDDTNNLAWRPTADQTVTIRPLTYKGTPYREARCSCQACCGTRVSTVQEGVSYLLPQSGTFGYYPMLCIFRSACSYLQALYDPAIGVW